MPCEEQAYMLIYAKASKAESLINNKNEWPLFFPLDVLGARVEYSRYHINYLRNTFIRAKFFLESDVERDTVHGLEVINTTSLSPVLLSPKSFSLKIRSAAAHHAKTTVEKIRLWEYASRQNSVCCGLLTLFQNRDGSDRFDDSTRLGYSCFSSIWG